MPTIFPDPMHALKPGIHFRIFLPDGSTKFSPITSVDPPQVHIDDRTFHIANDRLLLSPYYPPVWKTADGFVYEYLGAEGINLDIKPASAR